MLVSEQFPLILRDERASRRLSLLLTTINEAETAGSIANPKFVDAKDTLNRIIDDAFGHNASVFADERSWAYHNELDFMYANHVAGKLKKAQKLLKSHESHLIHPETSKKLAVDQVVGQLIHSYIDLLTEFQILHLALESLKGNVVKRQIRPVEDRDVYVPPVASWSAVGIVADVLTTMTDGLKVHYADQLYVRDKQAVEHRIANPETRAQKMKRRFPDTLASLMGKVGDDWDSVEGNYRKLLPNYREIIREISDRDADLVQRQFLAKNVKKLAKILEDKGDLKGTPTILELHVSVSGFAGEIRVEFGDGASFIVKNQVVVKRSIHGRQFLQFPTTFRDVVLSDGRQMSQPSERKMIEEFTHKASGHLS